MYDKDDGVEQTRTGRTGRDVIEGLQQIGDRSMGEEYEEFLILEWSVERRLRGCNTTCSSIQCRYCTNRRWKIEKWTFRVSFVKSGRTFGPPKHMKPIRR
jgi:hypothetical protein